MPFFSKVFRAKDPSPVAKSRTAASQNAARTMGPPKPAPDAWIRKEVSADEVQDLLHVCTQEMKNRGLQMPFLLLPFRPASDPSAAKYFIRSYFQAAYNRSDQYQGQGLHNELRLCEPQVLGSIMKWCWSRLQGGVVTWDTYELFKVGERESQMAKHSFDTFIPLSVESDARRSIVFDFFDLLAAIAANGKTNGLSGRKLSRLAGWWAFEFADVGKGFEGGYRTWESAADATTHLFFAYLRSLSADPSGGVSGISKLPRSLEALLSQTEYPPEPAYLLQTTTPKVLMIVNSVSPTPFALLRRAKHFEYRDEDQVLQRFSDYDDPVQILTPECRRVLESISSTNRSIAPSSQTAAPADSDNSWSRFEDIGFSSVLDGASTNGETNKSTFPKLGGTDTLKSSPSSPTRDFGRPTTPSWADFLSEGFADGSSTSQPQPLLLPPSQILPPISPSRIHSSQSHVRNGLREDNLEPGELASINKVEMDETFWWVWMTSLAAEEPPARKAVFGRCALIETEIRGGRWLVMEEQVKGAAARLEEGAYVAEKKSRFTLNRSKTRRKSTGKKAPERLVASNLSSAPSKTSILPAQQAKVQAAAAALIQERKDREAAKVNVRRSRTEPDVDAKTSSVMTLQPVILKEAAPAMKWASKFDKEAIRAKYLGDASFGKGESREDLFAVANGETVKNPAPAPRDITPPPKQDVLERELPQPPVEQTVPEPEPSLVKETLPAPAQVPEPAPTQVPEPVPSPPAPQAPAIAERVIAAPVVEDHTTTQPEPDHSQLNGVVAEEPKATTDNVQEDRDIVAAGTSAPVVQDASPRTNRAPTIEAAVKAWESKAAGSSSIPDKPLAAQKSKKNGKGGFKKLFSRKEKPGVTSSQLAVPQPTIVNRQVSTTRKPVAESPYVDSAIDTRKVQSDFSGIDGGEPGPVISNNSDGSYAPDQTARDASAVAGTASVPAELGSRPHTPSLHGDRDPYANHIGELAAEQSPRAPDTSNAVPSHDTYAADHELADDETSEADQSYPHSQQPSTSTAAVTDRWAQIRKNAAERRQSEEQSLQSGRPSQSARTVGTERSDDGETSGEETIESRVARIKARVAELTGNLASSTGDDAANGSAEVSAGAAARSPPIYGQS